MVPNIVLLWSRGMKEMGVITEEEMATRVQELGEMFDYWGPASNRATQEIIKGLKGAKKEAQDLLEVAATSLETLTGEGSMLDRLISEEQTKEVLDATKAMIRSWAADVADFGFEGFRPFSVDPAETARATRQLAEFQNRLAAVRKTDLDRQEDEIRDFYLGEIAAQNEALTRQLINEEQFAALRVAIEARMNEEIALLRASGAEDLAKIDAVALAAAEKQETALREMLQASLQAQRELRQSDLQNTVDAENRRFEEQKAIWLREVNSAAEHAAVLEVLTNEHEARMLKIHEEFGAKFAAEAKAEADAKDALLDRDRQQARDQMEFMRDLELQAQVFRSEGAAKRLAEIERTYEAERESVMRRAALLELDADSVAQYLEALDLEHARAILAITGSTSEGIQEALRELRNARETEFEAARDATLEIVRTGERALGDFILSIGDSAKSAKEKISDLLSTMLNANARIASEKAASQIFGAFGFADGGVMQGQRVDFRSFASGGVAHRPTMALFAEVPGKAEAFVPLPDGQRIPVKLDVSGLSRQDRGGRGGGETTVNLSWNVQVLDASDFSTMLDRRRSQIQGMFVDALQTSPGYRGAVREANGAF